MQKLLLFDIDRTLILNSSEKRFDMPIKNLHNVVVNANKDFSGLTDQLILAKLLTSEGWAEDQIQSAMPSLINELRSVYTESFTPSSITLLPGVRELLEEFTKFDVVIGLITGNIKEIAKLKLETVGIYSYFTVGAFGNDDHASRSELVTLAAKRAGFDKKLSDIFVFGDTDLDIIASLEAGVQNAIGVSNGFASTESLLAAGAKWAFGDFTKTNKVIEQLRIERPASL